MTHPDLVRRLFSRVLILSLIGGVSWPTMPVRAATGLMIGEVAWAGSSASQADEWIELWNLGDVDMPLLGYSLVGASANPIFFPDDAVVPARGTYLIANYSDADAKSALATSPQMVTTTVSLSNTTLLITLFDANGTEIDRVGDGGVPLSGVSGDTKTTMIRDGTSWKNATSSLGFDVGNIDLGTPGFCDGCSHATFVEAPPEAEEPILEVAQTEVTSTMPLPEEVVTGTTSTETMVASSTDLILEPESATSSSSPVIDDIATSSTEAVLIEAIVATSSIVAAPDITTSTAATSAAPPFISLQNTAAPTPPPHYELLRLNELMPQPDGEAEWIEITSLNPDIAVALQNLQIHDSTGKIYTFATGTLDGTTPFMRIFLASSRLNNDGDEVSLHAPNGSLLESLTFASSKKGQAWARSPDGIGPWQLTLKATPNLPNIIPPPPPPALVPTPSPAPQTITMAVAEEEAPEPVISEAVEATPPVVPVISAASAPISPKKPSKTKPKSTSKQTVKKIVQPKVKKTASQSTKSAKLAPEPITFAMTQQDTYAGIRVSLQGSVASPPGLLSGHGFILLSPDGRGLLVRVPTSRKLPEMGTALNVNGVLIFSDAGIPSLKLNASDGWSVLSGVTEGSRPRSIDLLTPSGEDSWSLVQATGTVQSIKGNVVNLDVDGADIRLAIRPIIKYRSARLAIGDIISVRGLLDLGAEEPRILPRESDDIVIVQHAAPPMKNKPVSTLPGWTPFGAAGIAIAGTEGLKHLRQRRKQHALEKILQTGLNETQL